MLPSLARLALAPSKGAAPTGWLAAGAAAMDIPDIVHTILGYLAEGDEEKACDNASNLCSTQPWYQVCKTREVWTLLIEHVFGPDKLEELKDWEDPKQVFYRMCQEHKTRRLARERLWKSVGQRWSRIRNVPASAYTIGLLEAAARALAREEARRLSENVPLSHILALEMNRKTCGATRVTESAATTDQRVVGLTNQMLVPISLILPGLTFAPTYNRLRRPNPEDAGDYFGEFVERIAYEALLAEARFREEFADAETLAHRSQLELLVFQRWNLLRSVAADHFTVAMLEAAARNRAQESARSMANNDELGHILALHNNRQGIAVTNLKWDAVRTDARVRHPVRWIIQSIDSILDPSFGGAYNTARVRSDPNGTIFNEYFTDFATRIAYEALLAEARFRQEFADALAGYY